MINYSFHFVFFTFVHNIKKMSLKILFSLFFLTLVLAGSINVNDESLTNFNESPLGEMENEILKLLELLRKLMKEGNPEEGIEPMEPLNLNSISWDFFIEDTTLDITMENTIIRNLSDFDVKNLTVTLMPKKQLKTDVYFPELYLTGWHNAKGLLFGEFPINDIGSHRIFISNVTVSSNIVLRPKAGIPQISDLILDFDINHISVIHWNSKENEIPESFVQDILNRFRLRYLPPLLHTAKLYLNDLILRLNDIREDQFKIFSAILLKIQHHLTIN